jgi:hypothetical protein
MKNEIETYLQATWINSTTTKERDTTKKKKIEEESLAEKTQQ